MIETQNLARKLVHERMCVRWLLEKLRKVTSLSKRAGYLGEKSKKDKKLALHRNS